MKIYAREQIKMLLAQKGVKLKELALKMTEMSDKHYSANYLSRKLIRGTVTYNEVLLIIEILGFELQFINTNNELI